MLHLIFLQQLNLKINLRSKQLGSKKLNKTQLFWTLIWIILGGLGAFETISALRGVLNPPVLLGAEGLCSPQDLTYTLYSPFRFCFFVFLPTPAFKSIGQYNRTSDPSAMHVGGLRSQKTKPSKPNTTEMNFVILLTNVLCNKIQNEHNISYIYIFYQTVWPHAAISPVG